MPIQDQDIADARVAWGDALIAISKEYETGGLDAARNLASNILDTAYGYDLGPVLFKPTLSGGEKTFRPTKAGALSYFVGHDPDFPDDVGFGLRGWREVTFETAATYIEGNTALWMGWAKMIDRNGQVTKIDKSFGYKAVNGRLKIVLHHSSLPYAA